MKKFSKFGLSRRTFLAGVAAVAAVGKGALKPASVEAAETADSNFKGEFVLSESYADKALVETDLLIVGTGFAGLWAGISAYDKGIKNIVMVDKGSIGNSSTASLTLGSTDILYPSDSKEKWLEEYVKGADYLSRQDMWEDLLSTSYSRMQKLQSWGLKYDTVHRLISDGNKYISITAGAEWNGLVLGKAVVGVLLNELLKRKGIRYYSKTLITQLLKENGRIAGAAGVNRVDGNSVIFKAKAVIIATGQCSFSGQHALMELQTGNGYALAYDAGATLNNMEFLTFDIDPGAYGLEGGSLLGAFGARVLNRKNQDFMWKYDPVNGMDAHVRLSTRSMAREVKEGRGPIFLDRTQFCYSLAGQYFWKGLLPDGSWQKTNEVRLGELGHDVTKRLDPFYAHSFGIIGAVKANVDCSTEIPGLFVAGITISHDPGKIKGAESARAMWSGERSGETASSYLANAPDVAIDADQARLAMEFAKKPLDISGDLTPSEVLWEIQKAVFPYDVSLLKSEERLKKALNRIYEIKSDAAERMYAKDPHELIKYHETMNMLLCAELFLLASIERKESRECHYREDYPKINHTEWLKWINFSKAADGTPHIAFERVPIENYPLKPNEGDL
ncbi:MAG: FAD-binding protein [Deferribacteraceae bacterium]|jgi:succinate dehydrogenase/fumarate reductase flavoprotein subunit|nr:FAD-binding protein [Deferribacteraceae bacterium]